MTTVAQASDTLEVLARATPDHAASHMRPDSEARLELVSMAERVRGLPGAEQLATHLIRAYPGGDWPVRREAMQALLRRWASARDDGLRIASRPPRRAAFGLYTIRRKGREARPYTQLLEGVAPIAGSCDCHDFSRGSLGVCKHLLIVLAELHSKPKSWKAALAERPPESVAAPRLRWDPIRPLDGDDDWLERVRFLPGARAQQAKRWEEVAARFALPKHGESRLRSCHRGRPAERLALVEELLALRGSSRGETPALDPALTALLQEEARGLRERSAAGWTAAQQARALAGLKVELYPYQLEGVQRMLAGERLLLADDMGLGKTAQAIASCHALWKAGQVTRGLLLVPNSLKPQWEREWHHFSPSPVKVVDGSPAERAQAFAECEKGFLICNYEQVLRDLELMRSWNPDLVVLDEAQRIKNWETKTSAYVKSLRPRFRLVLTGTPMENRVDELATIFDWVDDRALEPKWRLAPWHSVYADGQREVVGARNLDTLRARLAPRMLRRRRLEVLDQLPARTDTRIDVEMTPAQIEEHDALSLPIARLIQIGRQRPLRQPEFLRLMTLFQSQRLISNGLALCNFKEVWPGLAGAQNPDDKLLASLGSPKLLELREMLVQLAVTEQRKVVVFSSFRRMLQLVEWALRAPLQRAGVRAVFFSGNESQKRRTQNLIEFHDDPSTRVFLATDAGGVGLNLQRAADCMINIELPWNPALLEQRIGRIWRLGQTRPIDVYNLITSYGIEARIANLVGNKQAFFSGLFDGLSDDVTWDESGSFFSRMERLLEPTELPAIADLASEDVGLDPGPDEPLASVGTDSAEVAYATPAHDDARVAGRAAPPAGPITASPITADTVQTLLQQLQVSARADGGLRIDAPPEAAKTLATLLSGLANLLSQNEG